MGGWREDLLGMPCMEPTLRTRFWCSLYSSGLLCCPSFQLLTTNLSCSICTCKQSAAEQQGVEQLPVPHTVLACRCLAEHYGPTGGGGCGWRWVGGGCQFYANKASWSRICQGSAAQMLK